MISTDSNILKEGSAARARMAFYGGACGELNIIVASVGGSQKPVKIAPNVFAHPTASSNKFSSRKELISGGKKFSADIVTAQDPFETGFAAWLVSKRIKAKLQIQIHTDFLSPYFSRWSPLNKIRVLIAKFILPKADGIRVVSERIRNSLKTENLKLKTVPVILPVFIDIEKIRKITPTADLRKKYPQFDFIILMASRLTREKNIGLAIRAMSDVVRNHPKAGLVIVGNGPEEHNLKLKIKNLKLDGNVAMELWQNDLFSYYKTADAFLLTSNYEGFGMALVEAASSDCPVVSTDVGIIDGVFKHEENVLVCPIGNSICIAEQLNRMISHPQIRTEIILKAQTALEALVMSEETYLKRLKASWEIRA